MFDKHVAAELIKPEVLATNTYLAHELTSLVEECAARQKGPKGMPLMNLIISFYETGTDSSVALSQMHLLSLQLTGKSLKELGDFVKKTNLLPKNYWSSSQKLLGKPPMDRLVRPITFCIGDTKRMSQLNICLYKCINRMLRIQDWPWFRHHSPCHHVISPSNLHEKSALIHRSSCYENQISI